MIIFSFFNCNVKLMLIKDESPRMRLVELHIFSALTLSDDSWLFDRRFLSSPVRETHRTCFCYVAFSAVPPSSLVYSLVEAGVVIFFHMTTVVFGTYLHGFKIYLAQYQTYSLHSLQKKCEKNSLFLRINHVLGVNIRSSKEISLVSSYTGLLFIHRRMEQHSPDLG